jgi:3-methyl-2-oxobutanoate hydroxymethyltransferase
MRAGANAIKIEGVDGSEETIRHIIQSGVPVMGHLGLTPQSVNQFGGFKVQGKTEAAAMQIHAQARKLIECGVFALVLECVPSPLASQITTNSSVPVIGIGAGVGCDGQVLVFQDALGLNTEFKPKFVRHFAEGAEALRQGLDLFAQSVRDKTFPSESEGFNK